ncbi:DoxX family protein [Chryseobacterium sp. SIMBA_038]|uniref:DoxX family protein n=1 Tax=Chryseobacterium sp. SIMBA_038 TaxID=3085780 RepID=UPI00397C9C8E
MKNVSHLLVNFTMYFFILLFIYAGVSKLLDFENFQIQIAQSPLLSAYAGFVSYAVIIVEFIFAVCLIIPKLRLAGFYGSLGLMVSFTVYIYFILNFSDFIPCSCGGILEKMGWTEHLVFNTACVIIAVISITIVEKDKGQRVLIYGGKIIMIIIFSSCLVIYLYRSSEYILKKENNFTRRFRSHAIDFPVKINLDTNSFYFAGSKGDSIFLGNTTAPLLMGKIMPAFTTLSIDTLTISDKSLAFNSVQLQVRYPHFSITDGKVPVIFEGRFPQRSAKLVMKDKLYFSQILMTEPLNYIYRTHHRAKNENIVGSINTSTHSIKFNDTFLEKQIDGIFDTDGRLVSDPLSGEYIYTYFYRNEYRRLDKNLQFMGNGRTIDSTSKANIEITRNKEGVRKMAKPPLKVNITQSAYDGLLFTMSGLKGRHESDGIWKKSKIIDVYDYRNNSYLYSFPVYNIREEKARDFLVTENYFYVLIGNDIIKYKRMYKKR